MNFTGNRCVIGICVVASCVLLLIGEASYSPRRTLEQERARERNPWLPKCS